MSIIISEYVEGSGNNRAIELFNTGSTAVDLSTFTVEFYSNTGTTPSNSFGLSGSIAAGATFVIADDNADFAGTADFTNSGAFFDGNDSVVIKDGATIVDSLGQIGDNPSPEWGSGDQSTQDNTLRRDLGTAVGDTNPNDAFDPADGWSGFETDTFDGLGQHQYVPFTGEPSAEEQLILQLINAARANPQTHMTEMFNTGDPDIDGAVSFFNTDQATAEAQVAGVPSAAPLAWNTNLAQSSETHNNLMIQYDTQAHDLPGEADLGQRFLDAGYSFNFIGENIYAFADSPLHAHAGFYIDWGNGPNGIQSPPGHRETILDIIPQYILDILPDARYQDIGIAYELNEIADNTGPFAVTQHFGYRGSNLPKIVGVAIDDLDEDNFYDVGEGLGGITVTATNGINTYTTSTWGSGGYALQVAAGSTYTVTYSGAALGADQSYTIAVADDNVAQDVQASAAVATVADVYSDNTLSTLLSSHATFAEALAAAGASQAINITDAATVGDVGTQTISVDGLTIQGDAPFDGAFTLGAGVSVFTLLGTTQADANTNTAGAKLTGSSQDNILTGLAGNDVLEGKDGDDILLGGGGNDKLRGGTGTNQMEGGTGDDTYTVISTTDVIIETEGEGFDKLFSGVNYTLASDVEIEFLAARGDAGALSLTGNDLGQTIRGAAGNDTLTGGAGDDVFNGKAGNDTMSGGGGRDIFTADNGADVLNGNTGNDIFIIKTTGVTVNEAVGEGNDVLKTTVSYALDAGSEIETMAARSSTGISLEGNEFDQRIISRGGSDTIVGHEGDDVLITNGGADVLIFDIGDGNDIVTDFADGIDLIDLSSTGLAFNDLTIETRDPHAVTVEYSQNDAIRLIGLDVGDIDATDFVFEIG